MARMPALKAWAALSESEIGRLLLAPGISAVLMIAASSRLVARFGSRRILAAGVLSAAAGLVTAAGAADCCCLAAAFVLFGLGEGLWDVAVNVQAMSGQRRWNLRVILIMHALYKCRKCDRCRPDFTDFVLLVLTPGSLTMQLRMRQKRGPKDVSSLRRLSGSSGSWRSALMQRKVHRPSGGRLTSDDKRCRVGCGGTGLCRLCGRCRVVCRLVGELLRRRLTEGVLMTGGSLTAAAAGLMLCFCENPVFCLAAFALPGAGLSPVVPLLFSRAGRLDGVSSAAATSLISVLAYGGLLVVPPVIGLIAEQAGLEAALLTVPVLCAAVVAGSLLFRQK